MSEGLEGGLVYERPKSLLKRIAMKQYDRWVPPKVFSFPPFGDD